MKTEFQSRGALSPQKRRLLALMLEKKGVRLAESAVIQPRRERGPCPLSFAQERTWFFEQLESGTAAYNVPAAVRFSGALNIEALRQSLTEIMRRHEALRAVFHHVDGVPFQSSGPERQLVLPVIDLRALDPSDREEEMLPLIRREIERPFDLETGPLLRCCLWQLGERDYVALMVTHHIASDGWSIHLLFGELAALYEVAGRGEQSPLPELAIQYSDFADWQRSWFKGNVLADHLDYWKRQLAANQATSSLPTDHPRGTSRTLRGARSVILLSAELTAELKQLSIREDSTLFMVTLAAFKTLMHRLCWLEEITVGSPIANRNRAETEGLIGFFVNTLILRTNLAGNPEFRELLRRVKEVTLGAYAHQDMPLDQLVDAIHLKRDIREHPLFQIFFALNNNPTPSVEMAGVGITPMRIDNGIAKFDIEISLIERDEGMVVTAIYNADLFERSSIESLLARYEKVLSGVARNPAARLLDIDLDENGGGQPEDAQDFLDDALFAFE